MIKLLRIERLHYFVNCSCIGYKGGEWQLKLLYVYHHSNFWPEKSWRGLANWERVCFSFLPRRMQGQKPQVSGAFPWGTMCSLLWRVRHKDSAASSTCLCRHNLNTQSNGRIYPWSFLVPPGGWKNIYFCVKKSDRTLAIKSDNKAQGIMWIMWLAVFCWLNVMV